MAISINWGNSVISVPKADLTFLGGTEYELDLNAFRLELKDLEDSDLGMANLKTHNHNTEVTVAGVTLARVIIILAPYTITFEDGQYSVDLTGANSNVADVLNLNQVSVRSFNTAGFVNTDVGLTLPQYLAFKPNI